MVNQPVRHELVSARLANQRHGEQRIGIRFDAYQPAEILHRFGRALIRPSGSCRLQQKHWDHILSLSFDNWFWIAVRRFRKPSSQVSRSSKGVIVLLTTA
jgi:hypothetical protein